MAIAGNKMKFYLTNDKQDNVTWLPGEQTSSINLSADMLEISDKSSEWKQYIPSIKGGTIDATIFVDKTSPEQSELYRSLINGTMVYVFLGEGDEAGGSMESGFICTAYVTSLSESYDNAGVVSCSVSLQITGQVTKI